MNELTQKNLKNWRTFRIVDDGVEIDSTVQKQFSHKKLEFRDIGFRVPDYDLLKQYDRDSGQTVGYNVFLLLIAAVFIIPPCIALLSEVGIIAALLGSLLLNGLFIWSLVYVIKKNKKINFKKIHFSSGYISFYYRDVKEKDQVDDFIKEIDKALFEYSKAQFVKRLEEKAPNLMGWLEALHEREVVSHEEYLKYLKKIRAIDEEK